MSGNVDSENNLESLAAGVANDDEDEDVGVNSESTNNQEMSSREANYDSNNSNDDGVIVNADNNGSGGDSDGVVVSEDAGREDMFLDAPEDLGADGRDSLTQESPEWEEDRSHEPRARFSGLDNDMQNDYMVDEMERLRAMLDKTVNEKESIVREHKDEMEMAAKGIASLRDQMRDLINKQLLLNENQSGSLDRFHADVEQTPLHELIHECSMFVRNAIEEFQDLNTKSTEASVSREIVNSYMNSVQNESAEAQFQKDQYMEDATNRMLSSLASVAYVGELLDNSLVGKIAHIEKSVVSLMENYNWFLYQGDQLRQCLAQLRPELAEQTDFGVIYTAANVELLGFRNKETDFIEKMSHIETENYKLMEQLGAYKAIADTATAELEKLKAELEQEKHRFSNTKEKLSLAVTKGKALVQQRDSLKQTIADKTSELEKCLVELQEKSSALEAAELIKEELVKSQMSGASLQDMLMQKDQMLENLEDIILQSGIPKISTSKDVTERIRWLVEERNALKDDSLKFHQLADALLSIDLPENISSSDVESRLGWLTKSFDQANTELGKLQDEISRTRESLSEAEAEIGALQVENSRLRDMTSSEMDHLVASLSTVLVEKDYVTMELDDMSHRFEAILQREHQAVLEKEDMLRILLEASGVTVDDCQLSEAGVLVEKCLATIKEQSSSTHESSEVKDDFYRILQKLVYVKAQELALHENLLEDETQNMKVEINKLFIDSTKASEEIATLKEQNEKLQKDLERTEEKSSLIREKLSMAVKKGKGLVQEREGLKQLIDEKSSEVEKLRLELDQKILAISNYENETSRLSEQVQGIAKLEEDILAVNDQRSLLERDLSMSNKLLNSLTESINSITLPADSSFEEPVEKLRWLAGYLSECEAIKDQAQQQLENALLEVETLTTNVSEAQSAIKSLEYALAVAEEKNSQLVQEKTELEVGRISAQEQLEKAMLEAQLLAEAGAAKIALENSLAVAETNVSRLGKEKEEAESIRVLAEEELDKAKSEINDLTSKLSDATTTVKTLEDTVSHLESRISVLTDENNAAQVIRTNLEKELKELKEEADIWDSKLQEAHLSVKSLKDALSKAENDFSELDSEKKAAEQEISTLSAKLNTCLEKLDGAHGSLESRSLELFDHLKGLELLGEDETLLSSLRKCCESKFESLKEMEDLFIIIRGRFAKLSPENDPVSEGPSCLSKILSVSLDNIVGLNNVSSQADAVEGSDISLYVQKIVESFYMRKRTFSEKFDGFSSFLSECDTSIVRELQSTIKLITSMAEELQILDQKVKSMETDYHALENKVAPLEDDVSLLLSACTEATQMLQFEVDKQMAEITSSSDHVENEPKFSENKHVKATEMLLLATRKACGVCEQLENSRNEFLSKAEKLQDNLNELKIVADKSLEEQDQSNTKVHELETDIAELQNICSDLKLKLKNNQEIEANVTEKDVEISSLQSSLTIKEKEVREALYWASHVENLVSRSNRIDVLMEDSQGGDLEPQDSSQIKKLLYVVDTFPELQHQVEFLSHEKEELQTALADQLHEIEHLKESIQESSGHEQELALVRSKVSNMESGLGRIIQKFASRDIIGGQTPVSTDDILQVIEEQVATAVSDSENLKSKVHELEFEVKKSINSEQELTKLKEQLFDLEAGMQKIIKNLGGDEIKSLKPLDTSDLIQVLEKMVMAVTLECENLKEAKDHELGTDIWKHSDELELAEVKGQLVDLESGLQRIIHKIRGDAIGDQGKISARDLLQLLEKMVMALITESENSKSEVHELDSKLYGSQKAVDELLLKVKELEDSLQSGVVSPDTIQERSLFEATSQPSASEISEIEDVGSVSKATISPVPSSTHVRTLRKGSSDHIAVNIDSESSRLLDNEPVEDKGHVFKSLNTSGLVPTQGKMLADRIDGIWVSGSRLLMSRPRARLGFIAYWLFLHIWLLGTIL